MKPTDMTVDGSSWGFIPPELSRYVDHTNQSFPVTLRMADYDLDGYPDAVTVLKNASDPGLVLFVLNFLFVNMCACTHTNNTHT